MELTDKIDLTVPKCGQEECHKIYIEKQLDARVAEIESVKIVSALQKIKEAYKEITGICLDKLIEERLCAFCINPCQICHK